MTEAHSESARNLKPFGAMQKLNVFFILTMTAAGIFNLLSPYDPNDSGNNLVIPITFIAFFFVVMPALYSGVVNRSFSFQGWKIYALFIAFFSVILMIIDFAQMYRSYGLIDGGKEVHDGFTSLYFSIVTWTTLGYGDVTPFGRSRAIAALEALAGQVGMVVAIGLFTAIFRALSERAGPDVS